MLKRVSSFLVLAMLVVLVAGCGGSSSPDNDLTMDSFIKAFSDSGEDVLDSPNGERGINKEEKPQFGMIGAIDGIIFYLGDSPVKIYQYDSGKSLKKAKEDFTPIKDWPTNGDFVLESSQEKAVEIFNSVN